MLTSHHLWAILPVSQEMYSYREADFLNLLKKAAETVNLTPIGQLAVTLEPQGISAIVLLKESHIAMHFWPECGKVSIDIHVCDYLQNNFEKARALAKYLSFDRTDRDRERFWTYQIVTG